jgi:hypothetical protein
MLGDEKTVEEMKNVKLMEKCSTNKFELMKKWTNDVAQLLGKLLALPADIRPGCVFTTLHFLRSLRMAPIS